MHQLIAGGARGNAVVAEALAFEQALRGWHIRAHTYAVEVHPSVVGSVLPLTECRAQSDDILLFHLTADSPLIDFVLQSTARLVLIYHNITPHHYMRGLGSGLAAQLESGRSRLPALRERAILALADSSFNEQELRANGFQRTGVLPVLIPHDLLKVVPSASVLSHFNDTDLAQSFTNLLFVGRMVPNKCVEDVIKVYYYYRQINQRARLFLVGASANSLPYVEWLRRWVDWLGLEGVYFTDEVPIADLAAYYRLSQVYISMSEHEGFCVPLVESMRFHLPVVAYASTAIPETLGGTGILVQRKDFAMTGAMLHLLLTDPAFKSRIVARQDERVNAFEPAVILGKFREYLQPLLEEQRM